MNNTRKTVIAGALAMVMGKADASPIPQPGLFAFAGSLAMLDPSGILLGTDPAVTGAMHVDYVTGAGAAILSPSTSFFGYYWTAHNIITLQTTAPLTVHADMFFDWFPDTPTTHATADFGLTLLNQAYGLATFALTTLDGDGDGIQGNAMESGPFQGYSLVLDGIMTPTICYAKYDAICDESSWPAPLPAAVWLLGSGLVGLLGISCGNRRRTSA